MGKRRQSPPSSPAAQSKPKVYSVHYHLPAQKQLMDVPEPYRSQLAKRIDRLKDAPLLQASKLAGVDLYKVRQGDYRAIFAIEDDVVVVLIVKVGHRREVYAKLKDLAKRVGLYLEAQARVQRNKE